MRYALIGCGRIARKHLAAAVAAGFEIAALCDLNPDKARRLAKESKLLTDGDGVAIYNDYHLLLRRERPQLAGVATDSGSHAEIALECLEHGTALIVEKPLALSSADARQICRSSLVSKLPVAVCHQNRFNPAVVELKEALRSGRLGRLHYASAAVRWHRGDDYYAQAEWRGNWNTDGGVLMNQCIHAADMLIHLLGRPVRVSGLIKRSARSIEAEDFGAAILSFAGGQSAILEGTSLIEPQNFEESVFLSGTSGSAQLGGVAMNRLSLLINSPKSPITAGESVADIYGGGHRSLYRNMLEALKNGVRPAVNCEDGRMAVELVLAIYRSAMLGGAPVEFMGSDFSTSQMRGFFD